MGIFKELSQNVTEIGVMAITIILISILLNSFKSSSFVCASGYTFNSTANNCYLTTNASVTSAINSVGTGIDTSVTGVGTPITYITIIILVLVFSAILAMLVSKLRNRT